MADEQKGTEYVVLKLIPMPGDNVPSFAQVGAPVRAANDIAAIKATEQETGQKFDHGAVAVPARSWRPRVPKDEMIPRRLWQ